MGMEQEKLVVPDYCTRQHIFNMCLRASIKFDNGCLFMLLVVALYQKLCFIILEECIILENIHK